jgi:hypothetical protein
MMARRVYELLASGTPVISAPSAALEKQFPGIVMTASNTHQAMLHAERLLSDDDYWRRISHLGYREVMRHHTYKRRLELIAQAIGRREETTTPLVSIISPTRRPAMIDRLTDSITRQNYPAMEAIIITHGYSADDLSRLHAALSLKRGSNLKRVEIVPEDSPLPYGGRLNLAIKMAVGEFVANMDDDDFFFPNYLQDMLLPFQFSNADLVGKKEAYFYIEGLDRTILRNPGDSHRHTHWVRGSTFVAKRALFQTIQFKHSNTGPDTALMRELVARGVQMYAADPFNFIAFRTRSEDHTWTVTDDQLLRSARSVSRGFAEHVVRL